MPRGVVRATDRLFDLGHPRRVLGRRRGRLEPRVAGEGGGEVAARRVEARQAGDRERMILVREERMAILALRVGEVSELLVQIAELRVMPCLRLGIVGAGRVERHLHQLHRTGQIALQLARIGCASVRRGGRTLAHHRVEGGERGVVLAELEVRVADHAVVPGVGGLDRPGPLGGGDGVPEAVLRGEHRAEHPLRLVARARGDRGAQGAFRLDRQAAVAGRAGLAQQRVGEPCGRDAVAGLVRDPALERGDGPRETVTRRRRAARRPRRQWQRGIGARRPRAPHVHAGGGNGAHDHGNPRSQFLQGRHARLRSGWGSTPESIANSTRE